MLRFVACVDPPVMVAEGVSKAIAQLVEVGGVSEGECLCNYCFLFLFLILISVMEVIGV